MQIPHAMRFVVLEHFLRVEDDKQEWLQRFIYRAGQVPNIFTEGVIVCLRHPYALRFPYHYYIGQERDSSIAAPAAGAGMRKSPQQRTREKCLSIVPAHVHSPKESISAGAPPLFFLQQHHAARSADFAPGPLLDVSEEVKFLALVRFAMARCLKKIEKMAA